MNRSFAITMVTPTRFHHAPTKDCIMTVNPHGGPYAVLLSTDKINA